MKQTEPYPDFYCVGAGKSGTTSLYDVFKHHPQVFLPTVKEPYYFVEATFPRYTQHRFDKKSYLRLYEDATSKQIKGDFSPGYFTSSKAAGRIFRNNPDPKIIIILREPVSRAFSDYLMFKRKGRITYSFIDAIKMEMDRLKSGKVEDPFFIYTGCYGTHVQRFMDYFPRDNLLVLFMEDLIDQPMILHANICDFLHIDPTMLKKYSRHTKSNQYAETRSVFLSSLLYAKPLNTLLSKVTPNSFKQSYRDLRQTIIYRSAEKPEMPSEAWLLLLPIFQKEIKKLEALIGDDAQRLTTDWPNNVL